MKQIKDNNSKIFNEILRAIKEINYGEVVIVIHDSKIVQIEKKEKKRF
ncbi:YezD family protein [bacterium]|nr:YezD family protein [bacterium]